MATSYVRGPEEPLLETSIGWALRETVGKYPDREALVARHQGRRFTGRELDEEVDRVLAGLRGLGLDRGDRIGVWASNCAEWVLLQYACGRAGIVLVNVNPAYRSHELRHVLEKSRMKALFLHERDSRADYRTILTESRNGDGLALEHVLYLGTDDWERMIEEGHGRSEDVEIRPEEVTNIQYTSGTTGFPKGVLLTHRNLARAVRTTVRAGVSKQAEEGPGLDSDVTPSISPIGNWEGPVFGFFSDGSVRCPGMAPFGSICFGPMRVDVDSPLRVG